MKAYSNDSNDNNYVSNNVSDNLELITEIKTLNNNISENLGLNTEKKVSINSNNLNSNNIKIDLLNYNQPIHPNLKKSEKLNNNITQLVSLTSLTPSPFITENNDIFFPAQSPEPIIDNKIYGKKNKEKKIKKDKLYDIFFSNQINQPQKKLSYIQNPIHLNNYKLNYIYNNLEFKTELQNIDNISGYLKNELSNFE